MRRGINTMMNEIRSVITSHSDLPEKAVYEALVDESEGWKMRLEELSDESGEECDE